MQNKIQLISSLLLPCFLSFSIACEKAQENKLPGDKNEISFCSLVDSPEKYESKTVQTKAFILGFHTFIFYSSQCIEQNKVIALEMNYESRHKLIESITRNKINYKTSFLNNNLYAEITVLGELRENDEKEEPKVIHPKYKFFVNKIENINIPSEEVFPDDRARGTKIIKQWNK